MPDYEGGVPSGIVPSVVRFKGVSTFVSNGLRSSVYDVDVGGKAKAMIKSDGGNVVYNAKRFIGMEWGEEVEVQRGRQGYEVVEKKAPKAEFGNENYQDDQDDQDEQDEQDKQIKGTPAFSLPAIPNALVTPPEVGSEVVKYLLSQVSLHLGHTAVTTAVIAVPAKFNSKQREETAKAFKLAGLKVAR